MRSATRFLVFLVLWLPVGQASALSLRDLDSVAKNLSIQPPTEDETLDQHQYQADYFSIHKFFQPPHLPHGKRDGFKTWQELLASDVLNDPDGLPEGVTYLPVDHEDFDGMVKGLKPADQKTMATLVAERAQRVQAILQPFVDVDYIGVKLNMSGCIFNLSPFLDGLHSLWLDVNANHPALEVVMARLKLSDHLLRLVNRDIGSVLTVIISQALYETMMTSLKAYAAKGGMNAAAWQKVRATLPTVDEFKGMMAHALKQEFWVFHYMNVVTFEPYIKQIDQRLVQKLPGKSKPLFDRKTYLRTMSDCFYQIYQKGLGKDMPLAASCKPRKIPGSMSKAESADERLEILAEASRQQPFVVNQMMVNALGGNLEGKLDTALADYRKTYQELAK